MTSKNLVLRTMYIDPDVDDELRTEAFDSRTSKNDLLRKYLRIGMAAAKKDATFEVAPQRAPTTKGTTPVAAAKTASTKKRTGVLAPRKTVNDAAAGRKKVAAKTTTAQR